MKSDNVAVNTVNAAKEKAASLNVKNKKNKQKPNSGAPTSTGDNIQLNTKEKHYVSSPMKHNILTPTFETTVKNQSPNKKKKDKKKNKSKDNPHKQITKNEDKITETVELTASKKLKNKIKQRKQIGQLNKGKHQVNKQGVGNKTKKKFHQK